MDKISTLLGLLRRPELYQSGASLWTHPHIATEMLKAHLAPDTDAASYKPDTIDAICNHLISAMRLTPDSRVVDMGCGPGLYCHQLACRGVAVTGIDFSENSIAYAKTLCAGKNAKFRLASYLRPFGENTFDAALMISQDYGVLAPEGRRTLLANLHAALAHGGYFAMDVPTLAAYATRKGEAASTWEAAEQGFWRAHAYLTLHAVHLYPEQSALCDLYAVLDGEVTVYRVWQTYFSVQTLQQEMINAGFVVEAVWSSLKGEPWREDSPVMGVLCRKP